MKLKHNKKRNTAFLYEVLTKEVARAVVNKDMDKKNALLALMKEHCRKGKVLYKELDLYRTLGNTDGGDLHLAERLIEETKKEYSTLDQKQIFNSQTKIINEINKNFGPEVYNNFVPNYRNLATISQIFGTDVSVKHRVLLERAIIECIVSEPEKIVEQKSLPHVDDLVYKKVVENFNKRYDGKLHDDQKELIAKYINFFESKNLEFKIYLNEEISRLKEEVKRMAESKEIKNDSEMLRKTSLLSEKMERFREQPIDDNLIKQVLKIQEITREIE